MTQIADSRTQIVARSKVKLLLQLLLAVAVAVGYGLYSQNAHSMVGVAYGAAIVVLFSVLLLRDVKSAAKTAAENSRRSMMVMYVGGVVRFVLLIVLFAVGVLLLDLDAKEILIGFVVVTVANVLVNVVTRG